MGDTALGDTKEKMIMKDHDILIQLTTQMSDLIRRFDDFNRLQTEQARNFAVEMKGISMEQVRVSTEIKSVQVELGQLDKRIDRLEGKSNIWDVVNSFGVAVSLAIGYFFGGK